MLSDDRHLMRTTQSFPAMRGVIERIRKVFSANNPQVFQKMEEEQTDPDRFLFPRTRKLFRPYDAQMRADIQSKKPRDLSPNARLMSTTPFQAPMHENFEHDTASSIEHGNTSVSVHLNNDSPDPSSPRNSLQHGQGSEPGPSDRAHLSPTSQVDGSVSSHPLTISERLLELRPPQNAGSFDFNTRKGAESTSRQHNGRHAGLRRESVEKATPVGHILPVQAVQQLQRVIAQNSSPLSVGPLTDDEWGFYKNFSGSWLFDRERSDDVQPSIDILEIRRGSSGREFNNMRIHLDQKLVQIVVLMNGLGVIDEGRPWTGTIVPSTRRDRRRGGAECWVERYPRGLLLRTRWSGYLAANVFEYMELSADFMQLIVRQDIIRETGEFCQTKSIWQRRL